MAFTRYASFESAQVLDVKGTVEKQKTASLDKISDYSDFRTHDGYLYARIRAISSRVNKNHDGWPSIELAGGSDIFDQHTSSEGFTIEASKDREYGFSTFLGKPIFVDHHNSDPKRARGVIVDAKFHVEDSKIASADPYYSSSDVDPEHLPPSWVELLLEVDAERFPTLAKAIIAGSEDSSQGMDGFSMGCFIPGTPITLSDGSQKPIESIVVGDEVLTHTGKTEPVAFTMKKPHSGVVYNIDTYGQSRPMVLTEEHPVWVRRTPSTVRGKAQVQGGVCECGKIFDTRGSFGAHLREVKRHNLPGIHSRSSIQAEGWIEANDLQVGDHVLTPMPEGIGHPGIYSFARLLGYYVAEGNVMYDRKRFADGRPVSVEWTFSEDEVEYIQEVCLMLESLGYTPAGPYIKNGGAAIRCNSPELAQRFKDYGNEYSWNKRLHPEVMRWDPENQKALVDAYFNGDGCYQDNRVEAGSVSQTLSQQIQLLALRSGYNITPPVKQHSPSSKELGHRPKYVLQGNLATLPAKVAQTAITQAYLDKSGLWRRIEKISMREYEGNVYNFDVEGDDSYVAADIAVHNCDVQHTICNICSNKATASDEFCDHIRMKGAMFDYHDPETGKRTSKRSYENCVGVQFFEISAVFDPADSTALLRELIHKEAALPGGAMVEPEVAQIEQLAKRIVMDNPGMSLEEAMPMAQQELSQRFNIPKGVGHGEGDSPDLKVKDTQPLPSKFPIPNTPGVGAQAVPDRIQGAPEGFAQGASDAILEEHPTYKNIRRNNPQMSKTKTAEHPRPQSENITAPEEVDTMRQERICQICGSDIDSDKCDICFAPETLVRTRAGYIPISTVEVGDYVLSKTGKFNRVYEVQENDYNGLLYEVRTRSMIEPVRVTPEHPFLGLIGTHVSSKKRCTPARCNDRINHPRTRTAHIIDWIEAQDLQRGTYLSNSISNERFDKTHIEIPTQWRGKIIAGTQRYRRKGPIKFELTPEFLWMIGLYIAEGSTGERSIVFSSHRNEVEYQERVQKLFESFGYTTKLVLRETKPNSAWVNVYSSTLAEWFAVWLGSGSHNKRIPAELLDLPDEKINHLLRGILDGDGCYKYNNIGQTSPILALQIAELSMRQNGLPTITVDQPPHKKVVYKVNGSEANVATLYKSKARNLEIKVPRTKKGTWIVNNHLLSEVISVSQVPYWGKVYNLSVENDPSYTVQNISVHNCGNVIPPDGLGNPDLSKAQELKEDEDMGEQLEEVSLNELEDPENQEMPTGLTSRVWNPRLHPRLAGRINDVERPIKPGSPPATNEPEEKVIKDETKPVTSHTAADLIETAKTKTQENSMANKTAAEPADSSGKPDKQVATDGVGGVMDASNDAASKPDVDADVQGKGGIVDADNQSASKPDENENLDDTSENAGFDEGGNKGNNSGPTKVWPNTNSAPAVTDKAFPTSAATKGVKPNGGEDVQPQRREDVESEAGWNNSGTGTDQWTGTDGNGVLRQQDPVTGKPTQSGGITSHIVNVMKLADTEIDLGMIHNDAKYARIAELEGQTPESVRVQLDAMKRVRTAGLKRQASTPSISRMPSFRTASVDPTEKTSGTDLNDARYDDALFGV